MLQRTQEGFTLFLCRWYLELLICRNWTLRKVCKNTAQCTVLISALIFHKSFSHILNYALHCIVFRGRRKCLWRTVFIFLYIYIFLQYTGLVKDLDYLFIICHSYFAHFRIIVKPSENNTNGWNYGLTQWMNEWMKQIQTSHILGLYISFFQTLWSYIWFVR